MAKTAKLGEHRYLTIYTSQDRTPFLNQITETKGAVGYMVFSELYRLILGGEFGYYADANQQTLREINRRCTGAGLTLKDVENIIKELLAIGALDKEQHDNNKIYTNKELQLMHIEAGSRRLENYIYKKHFLLKKDDIANIKKEKVLVKKDKKCIFIDKKLLESGKNEQTASQKPFKKDITESNNEINVNNYEENVNIYEENVNISSRAKLNNTILNNTKENKIKQNKINSFGKSVSESNSDSNSMTAEPVNYDFTINNFVNSLLKRNLIPADYVTVKIITDAVDELESGINNAQTLIKAEHSVMRTLLYAEEEIKDHVSYITKALANAIENQEDRENEED